MPRGGTDADVRWFEVDPCYVFHPSNAWTDGTKVVCDVGRHDVDVANEHERLRAQLPPSVDVRPRDRRRSARSSSTIAATRSRESPTTRSGSTTGMRTWCSLAAGAPTTSPRPASSRSGTTTSGSATAHDLGADARSPTSRCSCEPATPQRTTGYVLSFVYDRSRDSSDLVILDASDIADRAARGRPPSPPRAARLSRQLHPRLTLLASALPRTLSRPAARCPPTRGRPDAGRTGAAEASAGRARASPRPDARVRAERRRTTHRRTG